MRRDFTITISLLIAGLGMGIVVSSLLLSRGEYSLGPTVDLYRLREAEFEYGAPFGLLITGNSKASALRPQLLSQSLFVEAPSALNAFIGGSTPISFAALLTDAPEDLLLPGATVLLALSPYDLNQNNRNRAIAFEAAVSWREIPWLVMRGEWNGLRIFVVERSSSLSRARRVLRRALALDAKGPSRLLLPGGMSPDELPGRIATLNRGRRAHRIGAEGLRRREIEELPEMIPPSVGETKPANRIWKDSFLANYEIDGTQLEAVHRMVRAVEARGGRPVLVLPPLSEDLRKLLGEEVDRFESKVCELSIRLKVPLINSLLDQGVVYSDGVHLDSVSQHRFTLRVAAKILKSEWAKCP